MKKFCAVMTLALLLNSSLALALESNLRDQERLEDLVDRLENAVERLEDAPGTSYSKDDNWLCTLKTTSTSYYGVGPTMAVAKIKAIKDCQRNNRKMNNLTCAEDKVKCEHSRG